MILFVFFTRREALSHSYAKTASASSQLVDVEERSPLLSPMAARRASARTVQPLTSFQIFELNRNSNAETLSE